MTERPSGDPERRIKRPLAWRITMNEDQYPREPHLTEQAHALRRRLAVQFDKATANDEQALVNALAMLEELKYDGRWGPAPSPN